MKTNETQSSFFDNVYAVVRLIPKGRVTSYGAIARYLGAARSARMVGWAMNNAHAVAASHCGSQGSKQYGIAYRKSTFRLAPSYATIARKRGNQNKKQPGAELGEGILGPDEGVGAVRESTKELSPNHLNL
jgi:hypothetical protein